MSVVTNHQLFSHTYLAQLQADSSHDEPAAPIAQGLRDWMPFRDASSLPSLIDSWVGPVLDFLEFHHAPVDDAPHVRLLYARRGDETPVGLCYVVPSGQDGSAGSPRSLDDTTKGHHPMAQVVLALRARSLRWGMLTDGARWRLVDAQSLRRYEHYLEIDLDELTRTNDPAPLRLFYAFFHRSAFIPSPSQGEGREGVGLDLLLTASARATKAAEDHLKARVSHNEGILAQLCLGLVRADGRARYTEAERDGIYRDATYLLYRMLFILHAEARGLLPLDNPAYRAVSLTELVQTAHAYKLRGMPAPQAMTLWERLKRLCAAIYESDEALSIPAYNGGLFDDGDKPYLRDGHIADAYLTQALFDLAYMPAIRHSPPASRHSPIDYRDLSVRHLGSLYEGMIEYRLQIAEETLWARRDKKGNVRFLRTGQDSAPRKTDAEIEPGQVYFSQSPGERRATGTYYTPEYIVDYIVRQTVVRGLEERRASLEAKLAGWLEEIATAQTSEVSETSEVSRMQRTADEELPRFVEEQVLTFQVCDPAMGSGHFLVNAAHQITNFIVETLHLTSWANNDIDADPVAWRRRVVERCLYGVDLSLMAVELAKLSLWLASVAEGKPLSFLDHHLRRGNSLIGARLEDLAEVLVGTVPARPSRKERKAREAGQLSMLDDPTFSRHVAAAANLLTQISARMAEKVKDIKAQEADYEQVRSELEPYRRLADLWTARHFGVKVDEQQLRDISKYLVNGAVGPVPKYQGLLSQIQELADKHGFFHWELELLEVFFDRRGWLRESEVGFDAVVGNPPYDVLVGTQHRENLQIELAYYRSCGHYQHAFGGRVNIFRLMLERAFKLVEQEGFMGFIVPEALFGDRGAYGLRQFLWQNAEFQPVQVFPRDDPEGRVFPDAELAVCIPLLRKRGVSQELKLRIHPSRYIAQDSPIVTLKLDHLRLIDPDTLSVPIVNSHEMRLLLKLHLSARNTRIGGEDGIATGFEGEVNVSGHDKFISTRNTDAILVRGQHVHRYDILLERSSTENRYLDKQGYLSSMEPAEKACHHLKERVAIQGIKGKNRRRRITACLVPQGVFLANSADYYMVKPPYDPRYLLAHLNSQVPEWRFRLTSTNNNINIYEIEVIPVRRIYFSTPADVRQMELSSALQIYDTFPESGQLSTLLGLVEKLLNETEQSDVVHDLVVYLAQEMIDLTKERQRQEDDIDLFRFVARETPCLRLDKALGGPLAAGETASDLSAVRHDIEGLRLTQEKDGRWLLQVRAKLRDPDNGWRKHQRDRDDKFIRQWLPVYRMPLDEATGRFYHYAFAHLRGFDGAGKFPGGYTRTTLEKLKATQVPRFVPVDLAPLAALEAELAEVRRKICLTDDLIDQIVYKLSGLTEEEIAIVEGRA